MSPAVVATVLAAGDLALMGLELPTGWFADRYGHRASLRVGSVIQVAGMLWCWLGEGVSGLIAASVLIALGDGFRSGADQALLYRTCLALESRGGLPENRGAGGSRGAGRACRLGPPGRPARASRRLCRRLVRRDNALPRRVRDRRRYGGATGASESSRARIDHRCHDAASLPASLVPSCRPLFWAGQRRSPRFFRRQPGPIVLRWSLCSWPR